MSELDAYIKRNSQLPKDRQSSLRVFKVDRETHFGMSGSTTLRVNKDVSGVSLRIPARMTYPGREYTLLNSKRLSREFQLSPGTALEFKKLNGYVTHTVMCLPDDSVKALVIIRRQTSR